MTFGMTPAFVGFIVVALVGAAAEMASAFSGARKNRLDLSVGIALGSASQIALFVAPVLVLLSYVSARRRWLAFCSGPRAGTRECKGLSRGGMVGSASGQQVDAEATPGGRPVTLRFADDCSKGSLASTAKAMPS